MTKQKTGKQLNSLKQWYDRYYQTDEQHLMDRLEQLMLPIRVHHPDEFRELISINKILWERGIDMMKEKTLDEKIEQREEKVKTKAGDTERKLYTCNDCGKSFHPSVAMTSAGKLQCPYCGSKDLIQPTIPPAAGGPPPLIKEPLINPVEVVDDYIEQANGQQPSEPSKPSEPIEPTKPASPTKPTITERDKAFWKLVNDLEKICDSALAVGSDDERILDEDDSISALELTKTRQLKKLMQEA